MRDTTLKYETNATARERSGKEPETPHDNLITYRTVLISIGIKIA